MPPTAILCHNACTNVFIIKLICIVYNHLLFIKKKYIKYPIKKCRDNIKNNYV